MILTSTEILYSIGENHSTLLCFTKWPRGSGEDTVGR